MMEYTKASQEPTESSQWPKLEQFEQHNKSSNFKL